jgi:hypothetical protein
MPLHPRSLPRPNTNASAQFRGASAHSRDNQHDWLFCQVARRETERMLEVELKPADK